VQHRGDGRAGILVAAEQRGRRHRHVGELRIGGASAVHHPIGPQREPVRVPRHDEDSDSAFGKPSRHQQRAGHRAAEHDLLRAVQHVIFAAALRLRGRAPILMRERQQSAAVDHGRQDRAALFGRPQGGDEAAAQHHGGEIGLDDEVPAERLHQDRELDRAAAAAAVLRCERWPSQPSRANSAQISRLQPASLSAVLRKAR
jgi:hypothetical protein